MVSKAAVPCNSVGGFAVVQRVLALAAPNCNCRKDFEEWASNPWQADMEELLQRSSQNFHCSHWIMD